MPTTVSMDAAVYSFEGLLPDLDSPPIAARRALDHAGLRLTIEGWRSLTIEDRQKVTLAGVPDRVDVEALGFLLRRATPAVQRIGPAGDPDPSAPPEALLKALEPARSIDPHRWARLRALDRYALSHSYRRAVARSSFAALAEVIDTVLTGRPVSGPPPASGPASYRPAGYYSSVNAPPDVRESPRPHSEPAPPTRPPSSPPLASTHLKPTGEVFMVDVARKPKTERRAVAAGSVRMRGETISRLISGNTPKGEVLATARVAGIMAAKKTHDLIPLCHAVALTHIEVNIETSVPTSSVEVTVIADAYDRTGVEMEAMVAVSVACLTIYDMLKGIDRDIVVSDIKLIEKTGGRSGHFRRADPRP